MSRRKTEEKHRELLTHELSHRVKNTLAVVQALASPPASPTATVAEFRQSLLGRTQALARAHGQLLATNWTRVELRRLVGETLSTYVDGSGDRVVLTGGAIWPSPRQGLSLALLLHELATNAAKYGALSSLDGRLELTWQQQAEASLWFRWPEHDGPAVVEPTPTGVGSRLIERVVDRELGGEAHLTYHALGLICESPFPMGT